MGLWFKSAILGSAGNLRCLHLLPVPVAACRLLSRAWPWLGAGWKPWGASSRGVCSESGTRDLLRFGLLKEKPLWFDVYKAFPPLSEPVFRRPRLRYGKAKASIQDILYYEDRIRAKFYSAYGSGQKPFDLLNPNFKSVCQRFVEKYVELQNLGETDEEKLFVETGKALLAEGVILRRVGEMRTQESSYIDVRPQAVLDGNQPEEEGSQDQHSEAPKEQWKGPPAP
ncbi:28S ribosomal protein S23, mitochondrial isoform X2 [Heterocephalus glaber]|uniref:Small ribosomal subunit protein mS23 n=1 Tax=Heterocephalus glaber TaxID=10181 RepID=A0AAX6RF52_HETGA|nr:28S ribosomal protein S23, mitochondrial isoform X2 [Heterocephalus glaber]